MTINTSTYTHYTQKAHQERSDALAAMFNYLVATISNSLSSVFRKFSIHARWLPKPACQSNQGIHQVNSGSTH